MPNADMVQALTSTAYRLISASMTGEIEGADIVREAGYDSSDPAIYWAFQDIRRRGDLDMYFPGGMGLPNMVRLP
jgi:hypothetical protein